MCMGTRRAEILASLRLFDEKECALVDEGIAAVAKRAPKAAAVLNRLMYRLANLNDILFFEVSLRKRSKFLSEERDENSLIEHLTGQDGLAGDLVMPFKSTLSRTFLLSKIQFLRAFLKSTDALREQDADEFDHHSTHLREELAQSIYTLMAEELMLGLLNKQDIPKEIKVQAVRQLITIWEDAQLEIDRFCPLLESAWRTRNRITSKLGCLLGTAEYFRLVSEDISDEFLGFFSRDEVSDREEQAFEEFLFNMTYEEIAMLKKAMKEQGLQTIDNIWAGEFLGRQIEVLDPTKGIDTIALYRSYNRRAHASDFRAMAGNPGPSRTAEAYLMVYVLEQQAQGAKE